MTVYEELERVMTLYPNNPYIEERVLHYIGTELSGKIAREYDEYRDTIQRRKWFDRRAKKISTSFKQMNSFFFIRHSGLFISYDGNTYSTITEDAVLHRILTNISTVLSNNRERVDVVSMGTSPTTAISTTEWKQDTSDRVLSQVRETPLCNAIPESNTIQRVISYFYPSIFDTHDEAKYFLSTIGDMISSKNKNVIFLTNHAIKPLVIHIQDNVEQLFDATVSLSRIKYKYHDHDHSDCRIMYVRPNPIVMLPDPKYMIDIIAVSLYISDRHGDSDMFAKNVLNGEESDRVFFLKDMSREQIVTRFTDEYFQPSVAAGMTGDDVGFLWKEFITKHRIPNVVFSTTLTTMLKGRFDYRDTPESKTVFQNVTSKNLPVVASFIDFWTSNIESIVVGDITTVPRIHELEVDEIVSLYRKKCSSRKNHIGSEKVVQMISHFFPELNVINGKYIETVHYIGWDKTGDIISALNQIKTVLIETDELDDIAINPMYSMYVEWAKGGGNMVISKSFFERTVANILWRYIDTDRTIISTEWWQTPGVDDE
jgi:hypothetical protein